MRLVPFLLRGRLFEEHHLFRIVEIIRDQAVIIDAAGNRLAVIVGMVVMALSLLLMK